MVNELAAATGKRIVFYCAFGERSAMAVQAAQDAGLSSACHIEGGLDAWRRASSTVIRAIGGKDSTPRSPELLSEPLMLEFLPSWRGACQSQGYCHAK